jgi:hypothetical protein
VLEPLLTTEDEFTKQEILVVLKKFDPSKAHREDALKSDVLLHTFKSFPNFFTEIYNECLRSGHFPKTMETLHNTTNSETGEGRV